MHSAIQYSVCGLKSALDAWLEAGPARKSNESYARASTAQSNRSICLHPRATGTTASEIGKCLFDFQPFLPQDGEGHFVDILTSNARQMLLNYYRNRELGLKYLESSTTFAKMLFSDKTGAHVEVVKHMRAPLTQPLCLAHNVLMRGATEPTRLGDSLNTLQSHSIAAMLLEQIAGLELPQREYALCESRDEASNNVISMLEATGGVGGEFSLH